MKITLVILSFLLLIGIEYERGLQVKELQDHVNKLANLVVYDRHRVDILARDR